MSQTASGLPPPPSPAWRYLTLALIYAHSPQQKVEHRHGDLLVAIGEEQTAAANKGLEELMEEISRIGNSLRGKLKQMDRDNKKAEQENKAGSADLRIRKSQHSTLSRKFVAVMTSYNDVQADNKNKYREAIKRQCKIVDPTIAEDQIDHLIATNSTVDVCAPPPGTPPYPPTICSVDF